MNGINGHPDEVGMIKSAADNLSSWVVDKEGEVSPVDQTTPPLLEYDKTRELLRKQTN